MALASRSRAARVVEGTRRKQVSKGRQRQALLIAGWILVALVGLGLWQGLSGRVLDPFFFSSPSEIWYAAVSLARSGQLATNAVPTVVEASLGYGLGVALAIALAATLGLSRRAYLICEPFILALFSVPAIAFAPILIVLFGVGPVPKVLLAGYFVFLVVFLNAVAGVRAAPSEWIKMARLLGASGHQTITKIVLPAAGPYLTAGLKAALPQAAIGAVVGEFIASQHGIGYLIRGAAARYQTAGVLAATMILSAGIGAISLLLNRAAIRNISGMS